jgi:hypothetical protein
MAFGFADKKMTYRVKHFECQGIENDQQAGAIAFNNIIESRGMIFVSFDVNTSSKAVQFTSYKVLESLNGDEDFVSGDNPFLYMSTFSGFNKWFKIQSISDNAYVFLETTMQGSEWMEYLRIYLDRRMPKLYYSKSTIGTGEHPWRQSGDGTLDCKVSDGVIKNDQPIY